MQPAAPPAELPWYKELTGYQWFVFIVCCLAWDMDCMDQQLFNLARRPAMQELVEKVQPTDPRLPELRTQLESKASGPVTDAVVIAARQDGDIGQAAGIATAYLHDRLGGGRHRLRRHGGPRWPRQNPHADHPALCGLHRLERFFALDVRVLRVPFPDRPWRGRRVRRRRHAPGGEHARAIRDPPHRPVPGLERGRQLCGCGHQHRFRQGGLQRLVRRPNAAGLVRHDSMAPDVPGRHHSGTVGRNDSDLAQRATEMAGPEGRRRREKRILRRIARR